MVDINKNDLLNVLITDRFDLEAQALLMGQKNLSVKRSVSFQPAPDELSDVDALVIRSRTKITATFLDQAPSLKFIVTATSGYDHIDLAETTKRGIKVSFTPSANATSAAELTWSLVMACVRRIPEAHRAVLDGNWKRESLIGRELANGTYGIIGLGRIGSRVAKFAKAFDMTVVAYDPYCEASQFEKSGAQRVSLDELMRLADVVSIHVPATEETQNMITPLLLESMSRTAYFINASRGSVVTERTLLQALTEKWIAGCGLDVYEREPLPTDSALLKFPNVVFTPHIGATTAAAFEAASNEAAQKVVAFSKGHLPTDLLATDGSAANDLASETKSATKSTN